MPRSVPSCTARGGGGPNFGGNVGWGRVTIPMPPLKKLVAYKKMGDTAGGFGILRVSSDLFRQIYQIHLGFLRFVCQILKGP